MSHVSPVFTEYEQQVIRELALHRVQPNAVQRLLGGATTLAEGIPGAQLVIPSLILTDVTSSMTLLSRHTCRIATAYGYSSKNAGNFPHLVAAMAPQSETSDEGYLALKTAVITSI